MYNAKLYAYLLPEGTVGTVSLFNRLVKRTTRSVYDRHTGQYVAEPFVYASCTGLPYLLPITAATTVAEVYGAAVAWAKECNGGTFDGTLPPHPAVAVLRCVRCRDRRCARLQMWATCPA